MILKKTPRSFNIAGRYNLAQHEHSGTLIECSLSEVIFDVEQAAMRVARAYRRTGGLILSEDDLKCALFYRLYPMYSASVPTINRGISAIALHTELPWYDERGLLRLRPDLSIIDSRRLSILHGIGERVGSNGTPSYRLPSKGCEFGGQAVAVETKFVRAFTGITRRHITSFKKDIDKMQRLCLRHNYDPSNPNVKGVFIVFSKTDKGGEYVEELKSRNLNARDISIIYHSAGVISVRQIS